MKRFICYALALMLVLSNVLAGFAEELSYSKEKDAIYAKLEENYLKALGEINQVKYAENYQKEKIDTKNEILNNLQKRSDKFVYVKYDKESESTMVVSEDGYAVATVNDGFIDIIDYSNGERNVVSIDMKASVKKSNENNDIIETPRSEIYEEDFYSYCGYFSFYQRIATNNYRYYKLTIPEAYSPYSPITEARSTSGSETQAFETKAYDFLAQMQEARDMAEAVEYRCKILAKDVFFEITNTQDIADYVNICIGLYESLSAASDNAFEAALFSAIVNTGSVVSDQFLAYVSEFTNGVMALSESIVYRIQLSNLRDCFYSFCNA